MPSTSPRLRVLAIEPYYGGSHRSYLDAWIARSRHLFTLITLPAHHWKWRMRHAGVTCSERIASLEPASWDVVWCSSMLPLADLLALTPKVRGTPTVAYFHENQAAYPNLKEDPRDVQFLFTQWTTARAATEIWFNSNFNRDTFFSGLSSLFQRVPDHKTAWNASSTYKKSRIVYPGVSTAEDLNTRDLAPQTTQPPHILWVARWEHDKAPELFFQALFALSQEGLAFRLSVLGQSYQQVPGIFETAKERLAAHVEHWGYAEPRAAYEQILQQANIVVSTAQHEFFGIAVVEATIAGCTPLVPNALAYPEVLGDTASYFDGSLEGLVKQLRRLLSVRQPRRNSPELARRFGWKTRAAETDRLVELVASGASNT